LRTRKYQDKKTGDDRYIADIVAREMQMLDSRSEGAQQPQQQTQAQQGYQQEQAPQQQAPQQAPQPVNNMANTAPPNVDKYDDFDDDIPF